MFIRFFFLFVFFMCWACLHAWFLFTLLLIFFLLLFALFSLCLCLYVSLKKFKHFIVLHIHILLGDLTFSLAFSSLPSLCYSFFAFSFVFVSSVFCLFCFSCVKVEVKLLETIYNKLQKCFVIVKNVILDTRVSFVVCSFSVFSFSFSYFLVKKLALKCVVGCVCVCEYSVCCCVWVLL